MRWCDVELVVGLKVMVDLGKVVCMEEVVVVKRWQWGESLFRGMD